MAIVVASWRIGTNQYELRLSAGEPKFEWDTPIDIYSSSTQIHYNLYRGAFCRNGSYLYGILASTQSSVLQIYYSPNGIDWYTSGNPLYLNTLKSNGLYYADTFFGSNWYGVECFTTGSIDSNANRYTSSSFSGEYFYINSQTQAQAYMDYICTPAPPLYTWQSVPSISGKNGILSLVTLDSEAINDGEPVSGAAVSVFDQAPSTDNDVKDLADTYGSGEESSAVDVTVEYKVTLPPGGIFDVLKLVTKKDSIPEDASDGDKIVDISPSKTKKTVTGLDENSLYYFKIFAEDTNGNTSESDEKHCSTGIRPIEPSNEVIAIIAKAYSDGYQEKVTATKEES